jgi:hypothetical protein
MDLFIYIVLISISLYLSWRLIGKTGHNPWLAVLGFVPVVNIILIFYFVFFEWPVERELKEYKNHFGELPKEYLAEGLDEDSECIECQTIIPKGSRTCQKCGWSYEK